MCCFLILKIVDFVLLFLFVLFNIRFVFKYLFGGKINKVDWRININVIVDLVVLW